MLNLWHGIPIKAMGLMNKSRKDAVGVFEDDYFLSTSEFYNTIMNACLGMREADYYIAGYPRNDYLFNQNGISNLGKLTGRIIIKRKEKVILYMPTYRDTVDKERQLGNIFGLEKFDLMNFSTFLESNNIVCLLKLHPNEEQLLLATFQKHTNDRIILIRSEDLEEHQMDLYKIINAVDLLITDYSSIYFDYLLLNRPLIFTPIDFEKYKQERGFLLEPYDFWTPGPKCIDQDSLHKEIIRSLDDTTYYEKERNTIKDIMHKYQDGNSTGRVMRLIWKVMEGGL